MDLARRVLFLLGATFAFPIIGAAFFCAAYAATWRGVGVAGTAIVSVVSILAIVRKGRAGQRSGRIKMVWLAVAGASVTFVCSSAMRTPEGRGGDPQLLVEHAFFNPGGQLPNAKVANLFCEWDHVAIGTAVADWIDPKVDARQATRIRQLTFPIYKAMNSDPAFANLGSVLPYAYADVFGRSFKTGHYLKVAPQSEASRTTGEFIVFLHGSAGNFSAYWYALAPLARDHGHTLVFPSFGFGNWHQRGGVQTIHRTAEQAMRRFTPKPSRLVVVALSSAGLGAVQFVEEHPALVKAVVLLSARLDLQALAKSTAGATWKGIPVLLIHGADDRRIPVHLARDAAGVLQEANADVTLLVLEAEDHFLLFAQRLRVLRKIADWLRELR